MDYYDELLLNVYKLLNENKTEDLRNLINNELKLAYVPRDIENKLRDILNDLGPSETTKKSFSDDEIFEYLKGSKEKQLIAVELLNKKNLREYIDICNEYLSNENAFINAKVLLIDSLVNQEIGEEICFKNEGLEYNFIPKYVIPIIESDGFISGKKYLEDIYLKEPSKLKMSMDLLYKDLMMSLPINLDDVEGIELSKKIVEYIEGAFK